MAILSVLVFMTENRAWIHAGLLAATMVPYASGAMVTGALSWIVPKKWYLWMDNRMYETFMRSCLFVFENTTNAKIHLYGDVKDLRNRLESAIIMSNHQTGADWVIINMLAARHSPSGIQYGLRFVIKHIIHYVPLYGWYTLQHGFVYVRRFGSFIPEPVVRQLRYLGSIGEPYWLHLFPEGTRYNKRRTEMISNSIEYCQNRQLPILQHHFPPKIGAFALALSELKDSLSAVYDITIGYGQTLDNDRMDDAPNMFEFVTGRGEHRSEVHIHIRRYPIQTLPTERLEVQKWIYDRFVEKDRLISEFYLNGQFPDLVESPSPLGPFSRNLTSFLILHGAVALGVVCPRICRLYAMTVAVSPLLLIWTRLRGFL